jgi:hypothetical protein
MEREEQDLGERGSRTRRKEKVVEEEGRTYKV